jgi:hypothetical protein
LVSQLVLGFLIAAGGSLAPAAWPVFLVQAAHIDIAHRFFALEHPSAAVQFSQPQMATTGGKEVPAISCRPSHRLPWLAL